MSALSALSGLPFLVGPWVSNTGARRSLTAITSSICYNVRGRIAEVRYGDGAVGDTRTRRAAGGDR